MSGGGEGEELSPFAPKSDAMSALELAQSAAGTAVRQVRATIQPMLETMEWLTAAADDLADAIILLKAFEASARPADHLISEWLGGLLFREVLAVKPRLRPPPKPRGRPVGKTPLYTDIAPKALANLIELHGCEPSTKAIADEIARLAGRNGQGQAENIRRALQRHKRVT